ncbi:MAG: hypothetical protein DCF32_09530 [Leptolyngbya sp.]|nr:MAG: hypothetical protein DCF32_09530 [Leptolyngbya sp.]
MGSKTNIAWTDATDNPVFLLRDDGTNGGHWCQKTDPACANCYAESVNQNDFFQFASHLPYTGKPPENLHFDRAIVEAWARKTKPSMRFVCSMTDLFGEWVPRQWQFAVFDAALAAPLQIIQLLTKRPAIAAQAAREWCESRGQFLLPENVWLGVSVGDQQAANRFRGDAWLMWQFSQITWVSYEPAWGLVDWAGWEFINWLVIGGESGPNAREFDLAWGEAAIAWCRKHKIPPYMKQLGSKAVVQVHDCHQPPDNWAPFGSSGKGTNISEWPGGLRVREFPVQFSADYLAARGKAA